MALSTRVRIAVAGTGLAGVAVLAAGGVAFADPGGGNTKLEIVEPADNAPAGAAGGGGDGKDCPFGDGDGGSGGGGGGSGAPGTQAADAR